MLVIEELYHQRYSGQCEYGVKPSLHAQHPLQASRLSQTLQPIHIAVLSHPKLGRIQPVGEGHQLKASRFSTAAERVESTHERK